MKRFLPLTLLAVTAVALPLAAQEGGKRRPAAQADVRDFGAVGDGKADDTAAIQKAIESGMGLVRFNRGTFRVTQTITIDLDKVGFIALEGHGVARVVMAGPGPAFKFIGTHGGSAAPSTFKPNVFANQRMPVVDGLEIVGDHPEAIGVEANGVMQLTITRTRISDCLHGVHLTNRNRNIVIANSHIYNNRGIGVFYDNLSLHQSNIVGCHISYCGGGGIVFRGGDVRNVHIGTCDIESNHSPDGEPTANVLIDCTTSPSGTAEVAITGCTLQHNSKSPGSANIRVLGRGAEVPAAGNAPARPSRNWGHITIGDNVLSDVKTNIHLDGARDVTITGNTFWMGFEHNLLVENAIDIVVGPNNLARNPAYAHSDAASATNNIIFRDSRDITINGLHVNGVHHSEAGVLIENCDRFNINGCTILDSDGGGLLLRNVSRSRVSNCLIRDDRAPGEGVKIGPPLKVEGGKDNDIAGNTLHPK